MGYPMITCPSDGTSAKTSFVQHIYLAFNMLGTSCKRPAWVQESLLQFSELCRGEFKLKRKTTQEVRKANLKRPLVSFSCPLALENF